MGERIRKRICGLTYDMCSREQWYARYRAYVSMVVTQWSKITNEA